MTNLVSAADVRVLVATSLTDSQLDSIIERAEAAIIAHYGAHYVDAVTTISEVHLQEEAMSPPADLFLRRPVLSVASVAEKATLTSDAVTLVEDTDYAVLAGQGRLLRLGGNWGRLVTVAYVPQDDTKARRRVIIDLVRLALARTALQSENIAGEYSYTAPAEGWDVARARLLAQLGFARA